MKKPMKSKPADPFSEVVASKDHCIRITEQENVALLHWITRSGEVLNLSFGIGWSGIEWKKGEPMPATVRQLGLMRGVLNENCEGAGI